MSSIDERIVRMEFDNKNFEGGVKTTLASLKNLNEKLKMNDGAKGLDSISKAAGKVNLSGLSSGVETVTAKFSALGVIGATALANITNSAINAGKSLVNSLAIQPITDGFQEYETKMNSIQTILTNTAHQGTTLKDVTATLNELNDYADKTIYNFAEMTKNIGTFTAAGVDLDTSTAAIKGIANLAAASGSSSAQASSAMYQLSQALATGRVSLQDWNSVVNAGMGGKLFQDALIRTSEVMGTGADAAIKKYGSFRDSLTKGEWLTSDVLTETLKQISGAYTEAELKAQGYSETQAKAIVQLAENATKAATEVKTVTQLFDTMKESVGSGWAQTWEYIIGDKDQATKTLTAISDAFNNIIKPATDARNEMFKIWNENGGRDDVIKGITNVIQGLGKGLGAVKDAFRDIFPAMTGEKLVQISEGFKNLTEKFKMSDSTASKIKNTFKGLFSVFKIGINAVTGIAKALSPLFGLLGNIGGVLLTVTSGIGSFVSSIANAINKSGAFTKIGEGLGKVFEGLDSILEKAISSVSNFFKTFGKLDFSKIFSSIGEGISKFGEFISPLVDGIGNFISSIDFGSLVGLFNAFLAGGLIKSIKSVFDSLKGTGDGFANIFDSLKAAAENVSEILDSVRESLTAWQNNLNASTLLKLAGAIGILAAALLVISTINPGQMENALAGVATLFMELIASMTVMTKVLSTDKLKGIMKVSTSMLILSSAVLVLSFAMKQMSSLNWEELARGLAGIAASMGLLIASVKLMNGSTKGLMKTATSMIVLSAALIVMAKAVEAFGNIDPNSLFTGLVGVAAVLSEIIVFLKLLDGVKMNIGNAAGILIFAGALNVLAIAVKAFGSMDIEALKQGLAGIGAILAELAVFTYFGTGAKGIITTAVGLTVLAAAINLLAPALKSLGSISWEQLAIGLTSMAGALTILGVATALMPKGMATTAIGIGLMAGALLILSSALQSLGNQSWEQVAISLVSLAGALTVLGVAMYAMSGCMLGAAAMVVMAGALALLTPQLIALGNLSLQQIGTGLLALAGAFAVIGVAGLLISPVVPALLGLSGALVLLSLACVGIGAAMMAFGTGLALVAGVVTGSGVALIAFVTQLINLLPLLGTKIAEAVVNMVTGFANAIPQVITAITQIITGILTAITNAIPQIITCATQLITALCTAITNNIPNLIDVGVKMVLALIEGLASNIGQIVAKGAELVINFINGVAENLGQVIQAGMDLAIKFINGVADGLRSNSAALSSAITNLLSAMGTAALSILGTLAGSFLKAGGTLIKGLISGIKGAISGVGTAVKGVLTAAKNALSSAATTLVSAGKALITGVINGVKSMLSAAGSAVKNVLTTAKNALSSAGTTLVSAGKSLINGVINGVKNTISAVGTAVKGVLTAAKNALSGAGTALVSSGKALINGLTSGIKSAISSAKSAISEGVSGVISKAKEILKINSPSKVFIGIGKSIDEGLAKGITKYAKMTNKPTEGLTQGIIDSTNNALSAVAKIMNSDIDSNPVITPVMDLSNVKNGANIISNLLSNRTMSIAGVSGGISNSIGSVQNGVSNGEIVKAIKDLKNELGNTSNTTYQINGITYDDGSNITNAVESLVRAAKIERRI